MRFLVLIILSFSSFLLSAQEQPISQEAPIIRIRCQSLLNVEEPLYIINGKVSNRKVLKKVTPDQIASIFVIKDDIGCAIYGASGKKGVILITTKDSWQPPADYTLKKGEIPNDIFERYDTLKFGGDKVVYYLKNGKRRSLQKLKKLNTDHIHCIKVFQSPSKTVHMGFENDAILVDVRTK